MCHFSYMPFFCVAGEFFGAFSDDGFFVFYRPITRPLTSHLWVVSVDQGQRRDSQQPGTLLLFFLCIFVRTLPTASPSPYVFHKFFLNRNIYTIFHRGAIFFAFCASFSAIFSAYRPVFPFSQFFCFPCTELRQRQQSFSTSKRNLNDVFSCYY